jgi:serine protease AprX
VTPRTGTTTMGRTTAATRHLRTRVLALVTALAATLALAPLGAAGPTATDLDRQVVVRAATGALAAVSDAVTAVGGTVVDRLDRFGMLVARVPGAAVDDLARAGGVASVTDDVRFAPQTRPLADDLGEPSRTAAETVDADLAWADGFTGDGVGIALVDTGVSPRPGVSDNVVATVDVSGEGRPVDGYGHGTFMAGAIVGDDRGLPGIAPDAHLVSIKVADRTGGTSLSAVLRGLAAAIDAREAFGVRVVLLALGRPVDRIEGEVVTDPLQAAVEQAWAEGLVVVVPSGNDGEDGPGSLTSPGASPWVLTVGALDDRGTDDHHDDTVPAWTGLGPVGPRTGPDLVAPGVSLVSVRAPGSVIDRENPQGRVDGTTFRGSGTSVAAAVTAGAVAQLIQAHPTLSPDEVKGRLVAAVAPAPAGSDPAATGSGVLDVDDAVAGEAPAANDGLERVEVVTREPGEETYPFWLGHHWIGHHWTGHHWTGEFWTGHHWTGHHWTEATWTGHHWTGHHWTGVAWEGHHWTGHHWTGVAWEGHHWTGHHWTAEAWTGSHWL